MWILMHKIYDWYNDLMDNRSDPRVKDWPMMSSPIYTLGLCLLYAYFSKSLGPQLMKNRKAFDLRKLLIYYNLCQTIFSAWIFYEYLMSGWWGHYSFRCQPVDYSNNPLALRMAGTCWWYYISKFTEFFDTLFFILRKKNEHVSTLHVIHHGCMPFSVWMGMKFAPGGHSTFFALLNTFVHIVMYFYYMIAAMGPKYQKYIWWKKYLTTFQMVQFVAIFTHQFQLLFRECDYPKSFMVWIGLHGIMFLFLFSDFYKAKYTKRSNKILCNANGDLDKSSTHYMNINGKKIMPNGFKATNNGVYVNGHKGACMPILDDEYQIEATHNGQTITANGNVKYNNNNNNKSNGCTIYANGTCVNGSVIKDDIHCQHYHTKYSHQLQHPNNRYDYDHELKEGALSSNEAILNSDTSTSNLHQRKLK